jgi:hypothetical protein
MIIWRRLATFAALAALPLPALAQSANAAPARGTAQRTAILDAVRPTAQRALGGRVEFVVNCLQVERGTALANLTPQRPGGGRIAARRTGGDAGDGNSVIAILNFRDGRWRVVEHSIGATDAWYEGMVSRSLTDSRCY